MDLTQAQKTTLKAHIALNTNTTPATAADGSALTTPFVVNTRKDSRNPDDQAAIAAWYNGLALAGDNQPFTNLNLWNPNTTTALLKKAVDWTVAPPHGLAGTPSVTEIALTVNNKWWLWDAMLQDRSLDMTDPQVRGGVIQVWGDLASGTANNIGKTTCGKLAGKRIELALSGAPVGAVTNAWVGAHVCPTNVLGATLTQPDLDGVILNG